MMLAGGLGAALLMLANPVPGPATTTAPPAAAARQFAPPLGQPMTYRVTTRRQGRDGSPVAFSLVYRLQWERSGRGYRLAATLQQIESDANPAVTRAVTAVLQPLVGETMTYLVAPDGSSIDLIDADDLWKRALERTQAAGAGGASAEARQLAQLLAALPPQERDRAATADIRALVAPAVGTDPNVTVRHDGQLRTVTRVDRAALPASSGQDAKALQTETAWTIDSVTGLVVREQRQSWVIEPEGGAQTLVEERIRALSPAVE